MNICVLLLLISNPKDVILYKLQCRYQNRSLVIFAKKYVQNNIYFLEFIKDKSALDSINHHRNYVEVWDKLSKHRTDRSFNNTKSNLYYRL